MPSAFKLGKIILDDGLLCLWAVYSKGIFCGEWNNEKSGICRPMFLLAWITWAICWLFYALLILQASPEDSFVSADALLNRISKKTSMCDQPEYLDPDLAEKNPPVFAQKLQVCSRTTNIPFPLSVLCGECFTLCERGGRWLGLGMGKKDSNDLILSKVTLAFQETKEEKYFNLIHTIHKIGLKFPYRFLLSSSTDVYILKKSL